MKKCPNCGLENEDVNKFCTNCGAKLETGPISAPYTPPPPPTTATPPPAPPPPTSSAYTPPPATGYTAPPPASAPVTSATTVKKDPILMAILSLLIPGVGQMVIGQVTKGVVILVGGFFLGYLCGLLNILTAIDAYDLAKKYNSGQPLREWEFFWG